MAFSFRRNPDKSAADARAAAAAAAATRRHPDQSPQEYVPPSALYAFRRDHRLSISAAASLIGYQETWWAWREQGHQLMPPEKFAEAQRKAGVAPPAVRIGSPRADLAVRLAALEERVIALEAQLTRKHCDLI